MTKQASIITIAKLGNGYTVDARGAFGGGYRQPVAGDELKSAIIRAWQLYGNNPLGCEIIGDMPPDIEELVRQLLSNGKAVLTIRVSGGEADLIRSAAEGVGKSINEWCRDTLLGAV